MSETDEQRPTDHGGPWKIALGCYFAVFLALLFPSIDQQVDWSKGYPPWIKSFSKSPRIPIPVAAMPISC